jgi:hypothetical protein
VLLPAAGELAGGVSELCHEEQPGAVDGRRQDRLAPRRVDHDEADGGQSDRPRHEVDEARESEEQQDECERPGRDDDAVQAPRAQEREGGERALEDDGRDRRNQTRRVRA